MDELTLLNHHIKTCKNCGLQLTCTQSVLGEGTLGASMLLLGDSPRSTEDLRGKPFSGRAGIFMSDQLKKNGLDDEHVYKSYNVRCQPPNDRDPSPEEMDACWVWTTELLRLIRPRIIVTLGKPTLAMLARKMGFSKKIGQLPITKLMGKPIFVETRNFYCFPMLHPVMAMRHGESRSQFQSNLKYLRLAIPGWLERP